MPFYLSAHYNCHPNYAGYFAEKNTLNNRAMRQFPASLPEDVKIKYSADLAEKYYQNFQTQLVDDGSAAKTKTRENETVKSALKGTELNIKTVSRTEPEYK